jgi:hypothetical protein
MIGAMLRPDSLTVSPRGRPSDGRPGRPPAPLSLLRWLSTAALSLVFVVVGMVLALVGLISTIDRGLRVSHPAGAGGR